MDKDGASAKVWDVHRETLTDKSPCKSDVC